MKNRTLAEKITYVGTIESNSPFLVSLEKELTNLSRLKHSIQTTDILPPEHYEKVLDILIEFIETRFVDVNTEVSNSVLGYNAVQPFIGTMNTLEHTMGGLFNYDGTVFNPESSPISVLLDNMLIARSVFKKKMLVSKSEGDNSMAVVNDNLQKVKKEVANSFVGWV